MTKYLYLTERNWITPWINGGRVPISPASTYLSTNRIGTRTPDENLIHESSVDFSSLKDLGIHMENVKNITMINCSANGVPINFVDASYYSEDGLILSFCNKKSMEICARLGKLACVAIDDIERLRRIINMQLGVEGKAGDCSYTKDHQRNHFLKSIEDEWQCEYRIFWPLETKSFVDLPPGIGRSVKMKGLRSNGAQPRSLRSLDAAR